MPKPRKYDDIYGSQRAYLKTEKGKEAVQRYQSSQKAKEKKKQWWRDNRSTSIFDKRRYFMEEYGNPDIVLSKLSDREKQIINLYFGLTRDKPLSYRKIAEELNISYQRVGQIKKAVLDKLLSLKQENLLEK